MRDFVTGYFVMGDFDPIPQRKHSKGVELTGYITQTRVESDRLDRLSLADFIESLATYTMILQSMILQI